jgi:hypothetical protein
MGEKRIRVQCPDRFRVLTRERRLYDVNGEQLKGGVSWLVATEQEQV